MKSFKEIATTNEALGGAKAYAENDVAALEGIIKRYKKGGFMDSQIQKLDLGDFSKECKAISDAAQDIAAAIEEEILYPIAMDEENN